MNKFESFEQKQTRELEEFKAKQARAAAEHHAREERRKKEQEEFELFEKQQMADIMDYGFNEKQAEMIFARGWDEGHSSGYDNARICIEELTDWVSDIFKCGK